MPPWSDAQREVDDVAVDLAKQGRYPGRKLTYAERDLVIEYLNQVKRLTDRQIAAFTGLNEGCVRRRRKTLGLDSAYPCKPGTGTRGRPHCKKKTRTPQLTIKQEQQEWAAWPTHIQRKATP